MRKKIKRVVPNKGGVPRGNQNAVRHGAFRRSYSDRRTWMGKMQRDIEAQVAAALGGDPSPQQLLIIQRLAVKAIRCACLELEILRRVAENGAISADTDQRYLRYSRELRADLKLLGLSRHQEPIVNLQEYLSQNTERKRK